MEIFESLTSEFGIRIRGNGGYPSLIFLEICANQLKDMINLYGYEQEHIHIKYSGDWDPSGLNIDYYIQKRLKQLGLGGIDFQRIAVTPKQIEDFKLPLMDLTESNDPNLVEFKRLYGDKATHLNALTITKHREDLKKILSDAIRPHWDESIYKEMIDEYEGEPERVDGLKAVTNQIRTMISNSGYEVADESEDEE